MDFEQLRREWAARDVRLDREIRLNTLLLRESLLERGRLNIRRRGQLGVLSIAGAILMIVLLGAFNAKHFLQWRFFLPGVVLHVWMVVVFATELYQREKLRHLDFTRPVVMLLRDFESLRLRRLRAIRWMLLTGQLVWWVPFAIVAVKGLLGVDLYSLSPFMPTFLFWNVAVGLLVIVLANSILRWIRQRFGDRPGYQRFMDEFAGSDIVATREFLATLARFENDDAASAQDAKAGER